MNREENKQIVSMLKNNLYANDYSRAEFLADKLESEINSESKAKPGDDNHYIKNILWYLGELANSDPDMIESNQIEIYGEDDKGNEGSFEADITEIAQHAGDVIRKQQERIEFLENNLTG